MTRPFSRVPNLRVTSSKKYKNKLFSIYSLGACVTNFKVSMLFRLVRDKHGQTDRYMRGNKGTLTTCMCHVDLKNPWNVGNFYSKHYITSLKLRWTYYHLLCIKPVIGNTSM